MRTFTIATLLAVAAAFGSSEPTLTGNAAAVGQKQASYCEDLCAQTDGCTESYCKDNGLCFGLYHQADGQCFQPADPTGCDDSVLEPVSCSGYPTTTCQDVCNGLSSCKDSKWGSYCKSWQTPQVCFGIVTKADGSVCFASVDANCEGEPYACPTATTSAPTTTAGPTESTTSTASTTSGAVTTSGSAATTTAVVTTTGAVTSTAATTSVAATTTAAPTTTAKPELSGDFCGTTPLGAFKVSFTDGKAVLTMMGQEFSADYALSGTDVVFTNLDPVLQALLNKVGATLSGTYEGGDSIVIDIAPLMIVTATRC